MKKLGLYLVAIITFPIYFVITIVLAAFIGLYSCFYLTADIFEKIICDENETINQNFEF